MEDSTQQTHTHRKTPKMAMSSTTTLKIIGLVVLVAISFYAGGLYQKHQDTHRANMHAANNRGINNGGRFHGRFGRQLNSSQVAAVSGTSITVKESDGSSKTYTIDSGTQITKDGASANATDIAVGNTVAIIPSRTDSSIAGRIIINPASESSAPAIDSGNVQSN